MTEWWALRLVSNNTAACCGYFKTSYQDCECYCLTFQPWFCQGRERGWALGDTFELTGSIKGCGQTNKSTRCNSQVYNVQESGKYHCISGPWHHSLVAEDSLQKLCGMQFAGQSERHALHYTLLVSMLDISILIVILTSALIRNRK